MNTFLRDRWLVAHAAAATAGVRTLAIFGLSGGGKSISILRLIDIERLSFLSTDRVLIRGGAEPGALGISKHPRSYPGMIAGNQRLHGVLTDQRHA